MITRILSTDRLVTFSQLQLGQYLPVALDKEATHKLNTALSLRWPLAQDTGVIEM
jgi:hypothetical protein